MRNIICSAVIFVLLLTACNSSAPPADGDVAILFSDDGCQLLKVPEGEVPNPVRIAMKNPTERVYAVMIFTLQEGYDQTDLEEDTSPDKMSDKEVLDNLNTFGLNITIEGFKEMALELKSASNLAHRWSEPIYHFCYHAVSELWKRHLTHEKNSEILADLVEDIMNTYDDNRDKLDREVFLSIYDTLKKL